MSLALGLGKLVISASARPKFSIATKVGASTVRRMASTVIRSRLQMGAGRGSGLPGLPKTESYNALKALLNAAMAMTGTTIVPKQEKKLAVEYRRKAKGEMKGQATL